MTCRFPKVVRTSTLATRSQADVQSRPLEETQHAPRLAGCGSPSCPAATQAALFGTGAGYRGGKDKTMVAPRLAVLRPAVLAAVERFVRVNQASAASRDDFA